jgi:cytochrome c biogenesis protein ResB
VDFARAYVFHTEWFLGLMGLLVVNLVLCSWEKSYIALTLYRKRNFGGNKAFFENARHAVAIPWQGPIEPVAALFKRTYTVVRHNRSAVYAQRGLLGRCGAIIIHIGLLWTMGAGFCRILADDFGWGVFDSTIILPEGETTNVFFSRINRLKNPTEDNLKERPIPFTLRALDFRADYHPNSTVARAFSSLVELRDGAHSQIAEITMANPLVYRGFKITQNSFNSNPRIVRGRFRVTDMVSGASVEIDAAPGDPVRIPFPHARNLFFRCTEIARAGEFAVLDLAAGKVIEKGMARDESKPGRQAPDVISGMVEKTSYAVLVAALFPNFQFDENRQPVTVNDKFDNPAVLAMLFKNGSPNGHLWLFIDKGAQALMGQPHPEVEMEFLSYRKIHETSGTPSLLDFEVQIALGQKSPPKPLGTFWLGPGKLQEITGVAPGILAEPNVAEIRSHGGGSPLEHEDAGSTAAETTRKADSDSTASRGGGVAETSPPGGNIEPGVGFEGAVGKKRFDAVYLGTAVGNVTFLGFMKDPSVGWIFGGCIVVLLGTLIAFLISYREAWAWHDESTGILYMAVAVRGTSPSGHREFTRLVRKVARASVSSHK